MRWSWASLPLVVVMSAAHAAPTVTVTGRTVLRLTTVNRSARGIVRIAGDLRDADLLTGIERKLVIVRVNVGRQGYAQQAVLTGKNGVFEIQWPLPLGTYPVSVEFRGDRVRAASSVGPVDVDVSKLSLNVAFTMPRKLAASAPRQQIKVDVSVDREPVAVELSIETLSRKLGRLRTGADGQGVLEVPTKQIGQVGPVTLLARFRGDDRFNPTTARQELLLVSPVKLDARLSSREVGADGRIEIAGTASDILGPVVGGTVGLHALGRHRLTAITDTRGGFAFSLPAGAFPPGTLQLQLRLTPAVLWREAASRKIEATILAPRPVPVALFAAPPLATLLLLALLLLLRFRERLPGRRRKRRSPDRILEALPGKSDPLRSGLEQTRSRRQLLATDLGISGVVWDGSDDAPIAGATIRLVGPDQQIDLVSNDRGAFGAEELIAGKYQVEVHSDGYVSERFALQLPHRGNLRGLRVLLVPVRIRVLEIYRDVALPMLPKPRLWAFWTPRELQTFASRSGFDSPPFDQLTALLEHVYWGPFLPSESSVDRARTLARNCPRVEHADWRDVSQT